PSSCLCWSHNSGVSTPSVFSQSKNDLGLTLNQLPIVVSRPNVKAIFSPYPLSPPNLHTDSYITAGTFMLTKSVELMDIATDFGGYLWSGCRAKPTRNCRCLRRLT